MRFVLALLFWLPLISNAQFHPPRHSTETNKPVDSLRFYKQQLVELQIHVLDSLKESEVYKGLIQKIENRLVHSDAYTSVNFFVSVSKADYNAFNASIAADGFGPFSNFAGQYGLGFTIKRPKLVWDITYAAIGIKRSITNNDKKISASYTSVAQIDLGYDFVRSPAINIYPYGGIGLRISKLNYSAPVTVNNTPDNITNIVQNNQSASGEQFRLSYQAGIGLDFVISQAKDNKSGMMVFVRGGTNGIFGNSNYKIEGVSYDPGIKYGGWIITIGFKSFGRR